MTGRLEARLVQSFLEKKGKGAWELGKPEQACHEFVLDLAAELGVTIPSPWEQDVQKLKSSSVHGKKDATSSASFLDLF